MADHVLTTVARELLLNILMTKADPRIGSAPLLSELLADPKPSELEPAQVSSATVEFSPH